VRFVGARCHVPLWPFAFSDQEYETQGQAFTQHDPQPAAHGGQHANLGRQDGQKQEQKRGLPDADPARNKEDHEADEKGQGQGRLHALGRGQAMKRGDEKTKDAAHQHPEDHVKEINPDQLGQARERHHRKGPPHAAWQAPARRGTSGRCLLSGRPP